jgi:hypothetical protein
MKQTTTRINPARAAATLVFTLFAALSAFATPFFTTITLLPNDGISCFIGEDLSGGNCSQPILTGDDVVSSSVPGSSNEYTYDLASQVGTGQGTKSRADPLASLSELGRKHPTPSRVFITLGARKSCRQVGRGALGPAEGPADW